MRAIIALLICLSSFELTSVNGCCANSCSGHGFCNSACTCTCYNQWTGNDCSERTCAGGLQWVGPATGTDTIHQTYAPCSNAGSCDAGTGLCTCQNGFTGVACERMACPLSCSGHGTCISIKHAAEKKDDRNFFRETTYANYWEANRIFGCECDLGFSGYACQIRDCPSGDDPLTTGQVDEVQVIDCTCDTCSGSVFLSFQGQVTSAISHSADAATIKAALEKLKTIHGVSVAFTGGSGLCDADGVSTTITFTHNPGDVPALRVYHNGLTAGVGSVTLDIVHSGRTSAEGVATVIGTKENIPCNGRGTCDTSSGVCTCLSGFSSSDYAGSPGNSGDCGYSDGSASSCPNDCSTHGVCSGATQYTCTCDPGYTGHSCAYRDCPMGKAWFAEPGVSLPGYVSIANGASVATTTNDVRNYIRRGDTVVINGYSMMVSTASGDTFDATNLPLASAYQGATVAYAEAYGNPEEAHYEVPCSNRGTCDRNYGTCTCNPGFEGDACQRVTCPNSCSGRGRCISLERMAIEATDNGVLAGYTYGADPSNRNTWDRASIFGCACDKQRDYGGTVDGVGFNCAGLGCPYGDDPGTAYSPTQYKTLEVQTLTCSATGGSFKLSFRDSQTTSIAYNANAAAVKAALEALDTIGTVTVTFNAGVEACSSAGVSIAVQFDTNLGDLELLRPTSTLLTGGTHSISVIETVKGDNFQMNEVQTITCTATSGSFTVKFREEVTEAISYDSSPGQVKSALEAIRTIESVIVTFSTGNVACSGSGVNIQVNFTGNLGNLPLMTTDVSNLQGGAGTATVVETKEGTFENVECSNHGKCDRSSGTCKCFSGYVSSNGQGSWGTRGDCSYRDALYVSS